MSTKTIVLAILIASYASLFVALYFVAREPNYPRDQDEACVRKVIKVYERNLLRLSYDKKFLNECQRYDELDSTERKSIRCLQDEAAQQEQENLALSSQQKKDVPPVEPPPIILPIIIPTLDALESLLAQIQCDRPPFAISGGTVQNYPDPDPPPPCPRGTKPIQLSDTVKQQVWSTSQSVGRIEVRSSQNVPAEIWGTGFVVAPGVFVTTCHVIEPLMPFLDRNRRTFNTEAVVVDFQETLDSSDQTKEFPVLDFLGCSDEPGLDIAFVSICATVCICGPSPGAYCAPPPPLTLQLKEFKYVQRANGYCDDEQYCSNRKDKDKHKDNGFPYQAYVIGYANMRHFIDADRARMYEPWRQPPYNVSSKFVVVDAIADEDECDRRLKILLDTDTTTAGESGSPVLSPTTGTNVPLAVVGVHTCCSEYFASDNGSPPLAELSCARLRRTFHNQDISAESIVTDPNLCQVLRDHHADIYDDKGKHVNGKDANGTDINLPCSGSMYFPL